MNCYKISIRNSFKKNVYMLNFFIELCKGYTNQIKSHGAHRVKKNYTAVLRPIISCYMGQSTAQNGSIQIENELVYPHKRIFYNNFSMATLFGLQISLVSEIFDTLKTCERTSSFKSCVNVTHSMSDIKKRKHWFSMQGFHPTFFRRFLRKTSRDSFENFSGESYSISHLSSSTDSFKKSSQDSFENIFRRFLQKILQGFRQKPEVSQTDLKENQAQMAFNMPP